MDKVYIRFLHNQAGMLIEASRDGKTWEPVQLQKYTEFHSPTRPYSSYISTAQQEENYLASLKAKQIPVVVVR